MKDHKKESLKEFTEELLLFGPLIIYYLLSTPFRIMWKKVFKND